jgi:hypothetical protein
MAGAPLFDGLPAAERTEDIPVTLDLRIRQFIHRWGHTATAQDRMRPELDELIELAKREKCDGLPP